MIVGVINILFWILTLSYGESSPGPTVIEPIDQTKTENSFDCRFKERVECFWQKDGSTISRYRYKFVKGNGTNTCDCSINITQMHDLVGLKCYGTVYDRNAKRIQSDPGQTILLECASDTVVNCSWKINNNTANIDGVRHKYAQSHDGNDVKNCSMLIANFQPSEDQGKWECAFSSQRGLTSCVHYSYEIATKNVSSTQQPPINLPKREPATTTVSHEPFPTMTVPVGASSTDSSSTLSLGIIIAILISIAALVAVNIGVVLFVLKHFRQQKMKNESEVVDHNRRCSTRVQHGQPSSLSSFPDDSPSYVNTDIFASCQIRNSSVDIDGYLVPSQVEQLRNPKKQTKKKTSLQRQSSDLEGHLYEKIDESR